MALKGDLASVDLAQVFQMLALNQKVGMLSIQSPKAWKSLYFDQRGVTLYFNEHTMLDRILGQMVRSGRLGEESVADAREHAARMGIPVIESLLNGGFVTDEDIDSGTRAELEEGIYDIFFWNDARFEFFEGASTDAGPDVEGAANERYFFSTDMLIMEAARRIDEWSYIEQRVASPLEIHRPLSSNAAVMEMEGEVLPILELIDGKRNVSRLIEITGLAPFHLYKGLSTLIDQGVIEPVPSDDILPSAKECFGEGRLQDAINLFEKAISDGVGIPEAHVLVAEAYEAIGEHELANYHTKCVAEFRVEEGNTKDAVHLLQTAIEKVPTDLGARERIVELTAGHPELKTDSLDPLAVGKELVDLYLEIGELDRVRSILEGLLRTHPEDLELKKSLINVHTKAGDTKRVIELYESIAEDLVNSKNPIEAIKFLQKIVMLDRTRKDISERIKGLYQLDERRRSRRRGIMGLVFMLCLIVAAGAGYWQYDQIARQYWEKVQKNVVEAVDREDYQAALNMIHGFLENYPFTMVGQEVEGEKTRVQTLKDKFDSDQAGHKLKADKKLEQIRRRYKISWKLYEAEFGEKNLASAKLALERCFELVKKAAQKKDWKWWRDKRGQRALTDLTTYLAKAIALERRYWKARDSGDWRKARECAIELVTKYDLSQPARRVEIPVQLDSRPSGAEIWRSNKPLVYQENGERHKVRTPAVVYCPNRKTVDFQLRVDGFGSTSVTLKPTTEAGRAFVLSPTPAQLQFARPGLTAVGVGRGHLALGLQGGKIGIARLDETGRQVVGSLRGLAEVNGLPALTATRAIFLTNEGKIICHLLSSGRRSWQVTPRHTVEYDPVVKNDRVFVVDNQGRLIAFSASRGRELWVHPLQGLASGPPVPAGRSAIMVGSQSGKIFVIDVTNGVVEREYEVRVGISSKILANDELLVFGTTDGKVRGIRRRTGAQKWNQDAGRAIRVHELAVSTDGSSFFHLAADEYVIKREALTGRQIKSYKLPGHLRSGPIVQNGMVYVVVRRMVQNKGGKKTFHDLLLALSETDLSLQWRFKEDGDFRGQLSGDGRELFLTGSKGQVYRFK